MALPCEALPNLRIHSTSPRLMHLLFAALPTRPLPTLPAVQALPHPLPLMYDVLRCAPLCSHALVKKCL